MTTLIAWRNLRHDPIRFAATVVGIVFAVVLISMQTGMLIGFIRASAGLVENAGADVWVAARGTSNVDQSGILRQPAFYRARAVPGVAEVSRTIIQFTGWRKPAGGTESVIIVGFDPQTGFAAPWNLVEGSVEALAAPNAVMIDRLYAEKLGVTAVGDRVEIAERRAVVVGFTQGVRTFTQSPYVFTSYANALRYTNIEDGDASYMLVKAAPGVEPATLAADLGAVLGKEEVLTTQAFAARTRDYWILTTGAGSALVLGAALGGLVGIIIVAQTLYAATVERLAEYATLSAIGAGSGYLNAIVLKQAMIAGTIGFVIAGTIAWAMAASSTSSPAAILLSPLALALIGVLTLAMCAVSSMLAVRKLYRIDPTSVFR
ncbi:ABC transporter permease [Aureimonas pseudogalii]|uniref:Putative ABC transport system permease protein n=1 Tax=Aureimonas pseudogalii TaxID=1744844 RepID=A0A7W6EDK9_9HYPH|nr:ABC transporter permease [Aureimonas pseudogalii]MBB3996735.1 putative ABC transport system permease protein [Aureimonas pseudogalii]